MDTNILILSLIIEIAMFPAFAISLNIVKNRNAPAILCAIVGSMLCSFFIVTENPMLSTIISYFGISIVATRQVVEIQRKRKAKEALANA